MDEPRGPVTSVCHVTRRWVISAGHVTGMGRPRAALRGPVVPRNCETLKLRNCTTISDSVISHSIGGEHQKNESLPLRGVEGQQWKPLSSLAYCGNLARFLSAGGWNALAISGEMSSCHHHRTRRNRTGRPRRTADCDGVM